MYALAWVPTAADGAGPATPATGTRSASGTPLAATGTLLSCGGDGQILVADVAAGKGAAKTWAAWLPLTSVLAEDRYSEVHVSVADPRWIAVGRHGGSIELWSRHVPGRPVRRLLFQGHRGLVNRLRFSPGTDAPVARRAHCTCVLNACGVGTARLGGGRRRADGAWLASAADDGAVAIHAVPPADMGAGANGDATLAVGTTECAFWIRGHSRAVADVAWSPHEAGLLATAGLDGEGKVWRLHRAAAAASVGGTTELVAVLKGHERRVLAVAWCGAHIGTVYTAGDDQTVRAWHPLADGTGGGPTPLAIAGLPASAAVVRGEVRVRGVLVQGG